MNIANPLAYGVGRDALMQCLQEARSLARIDLEACNRLHTKLNDESFNLVAVGQFTRGKSSVINALLGRPLLPVGVIPLTSVITVIRYGQTPSVNVLFESGEVRAVPLEELADYVTGNGNPHNGRSVREVRIDYPSVWLKGGVRFVDTPGIGSVYDHRNDLAHRYMPQADAVLFVGSVDQPVSRAELDFLGAIRPYAAKILCLMNKTDYLSPDELAESLRFSAHAIHSALGMPTPIYAVSAKTALIEKHISAAKQGAAFGDFEVALRRLIAEEKTQVWMQSVSGGLRHILSQVRLIDELEVTSLTTPLEKVKENLEFFERKKRQIAQKQNDYAILLKADLQRLMVNQMHASLERFKQSQRERIPKLIDGWAGELRFLSSRRFAAALEHQLFAEVQDAFDEWMQAEEPGLAKAFGSLCKRFYSSIQVTVDELSSYSASLFKVRFDPADDGSRLMDNDEFGCKFGSEPVGLQILASHLFLSLPRIIGHRLVAARMRKSALDLVDVQAGRIRHALEERLNRSCHAFEVQLFDQLNGIQRAIEQGLSTRHRGEVEVWKRRVELANQIKRISALEARAEAAAHWFK